MDTSIGVGLIIGLITATSIWVWNSDLFSKTQKYITIACALFPPFHLSAIIIFLIYNNLQEANSPAQKKIVTTENKIGSLNQSLSNLKDLYNNEIISSEEYIEKKAVLNLKISESEIKKSKEYHQLEELLIAEVLTKNEFEKKVELIMKINISKQEHELKEKKRTSTLEKEKQLKREKDIKKILKKVDVIPRKKINYSRLILLFFYFLIIVFCIIKLSTSPYWLTKKLQHLEYIGYFNFDEVTESSKIIYIIVSLISTIIFLKKKWLILLLALIYLAYLLIYLNDQYFLF